MKRIFEILSLIVLIGAIMNISSCGGGDEPTIEESTAAKLAGVWTASSVTLDGFDVTNPSYSSFRLTINSDGSYVTSGGQPAFTDTGGFWEVSSATATSASLSIDGVIGTLAFGATGTEATLSFTAPGSAIGAGRVSGLSGSYVFTLSKQ